MVLFAILAALTVVGALAAMLLRNTVHAVLALTGSLIGLALLFLRLDAQFAGFAQILVYVGAVAILVVFAVLLTRSDGSGSSGTQAEGVFSKTWLAGLVVAAAVFAVLAWAVLQSAPALPNVQAVPQVTVAQIGNALMGPYVLPLEIVAVLLTAAMIGAVIVAMQDHRRDALNENGGGAK